MTQYKTKSMVLLGVVLGVIALGSLRFAFMPAEKVVHYHANFAMFLNGQRVDLTDDKYMEDVQACKPSYVAMLPEERTHFHNNNMDVVHVHDDGVTWGHFMANIGFAFGDNYLATDADRIYVNNGGRTMKYFLNGTQVADPFNTLIKSEDRLVVSFGYETADQVLKNQFSQVASDAHVHNEHPDPGSCSGEVQLGFWEKVKKAVWF